MNRRAFTLVELMIVVAIIGLLASVAMPMFQGYVIRTKHGEAPLIMGTIANAELEFYMKPRLDSTGAELDPCFLFVPESPADGGMGGKKRPYEPTDNGNLLGFSISSDVYFKYGAVLVGLFPMRKVNRCMTPDAVKGGLLFFDTGDFGVVASADIDGDGIWTAYVQELEADAATGVPKKGPAMNIVGGAFELME